MNEMNVWMIKPNKTFVLIVIGCFKWRFLTRVTRYRSGSCQWSKPFGHGWHPWSKRIYLPKGFGAMATKTRDIGIFLILAQIWYFQHERGILLWNWQFLLYFLAIWICCTDSYKKMCSFTLYTLYLSIGAWTLKLESQGQKIHFCRVNCK